jgi:hypothetical protein
MIPLVMIPVSMSDGYRGQTATFYRDGNRNVMDVFADSLTGIAADRFKGDVGSYFNNGIDKVLGGETNCIDMSKVAVIDSTAKTGLLVFARYNRNAGYTEKPTLKGACLEVQRVLTIGASEDAFEFD